MTTLEYLNAVYRTRRMPSIVLVLVTGCHVLVIVFLWTVKSTLPRNADSTRTAWLVPIPVQRPKTVEHFQLQELAQRSIRIPSVSPAEILNDAERALPDLAIEHSQDRPSIDWEREARRSVEALAPQLLEGLIAKCRDVSEPIPPECKPRRYEFKWSREPGTLEWDGLLPFVRLGERCVIGLGFFGCGIGPLPEPNGELFDGMQDPDRPRSSVPEVPR
jgi:hypothetical protein